MAGSGDNPLAKIGNTVTQSPLFQKSKRALSNTARFSQKLLWSTGKAAWIAGTSFLVFVVPLIIEMDREQQMVDLESQSAGLLGAPPVGLVGMLRGASNAPLLKDLSFYRRHCQEDDHAIQERIEAEALDLRFC
ncbi:hypothetical protein R1sor_004603 [Riccia sorocarpa]|uniref:Mitochondrial import receptor subunit TOM22 homolog n=1 Tax=Riccia sorocarpa TaxID=122646 RepID=A0ABD3HK35_9MARC